MHSPHVRILGTGVVSRAAALALAGKGLRVALQARVAAPERPDVRTYALNPASIALLRSLKAWDALPGDAHAAVHDMRIHGDAGDAVLEFAAWESCVPALARIVDAAELDATLESAVRFAPQIHCSVEPAPAPLTVIAEGKGADLRQRYGIETERQSYGQRAVAARLIADAPHAGIARQWFRAPDILALLPFDRPAPRHSYGLVWSLPDAEADRHLAMPVAEFEQALHEATGGAAGRLALAGERCSWPLSWARPAQVCGAGWVLVGDAAHVVHPLAGQGLNLGLADVAVLADVLAARESWRDVGELPLLQRYARRRRLPVWAMQQTTDSLWRLFASPSAPVRELRNRGLACVQQVAPLKRWLATQALGRAAIDTH